MENNGEKQIEAKNNGERKDNRGKAEGSKKTQFRKGEYGQRKGRRRLSKDAHILRQTLRDDLVRMGCKYLYSLPEEVSTEALAKRNDITMMDMAMVNIISGFVVNGDTTNFEWLLNRIVGKPEQYLEIKQDSKLNVSHSVRKASTEKLTKILEILGDE